MGLVDGGELVVRALRAEGVEQIFAISDISYTPIQRGAHSHGIRTVAARHESANVHMAEAWARASGNVAVAMAGMGPGVANLVPGVYTAWIEGYPMIVIGTQRIDRADRSIRRGRFQHAPQLEVFRPITKLAASVPDAERVPEYVREAFRAALSGRPGPSYLEFPVQVLREEVEEDEVRMPSPSHYRAALGAPDPREIERAARMFAEAEVPLVLAGQGVGHAEASGSLRALLESTGAGLMTTPGARGVIDEDDEHVVGQPMLSPAGARLAQEADVVLAVGTEVGETVGYGKPPQWAEPERQRWIQLDGDPESIGVNREVDCALVGDAGKGLEALVAALGRGGGPGESRALVAEVVGQERGLVSQLRDSLGASDAEPIHPARLANEVATFFGPDAITCLDGGNTTLWATLFHRFHRPRSLLWTSHFGHLGTGLPYAIGAKLAAPDRPVYLFTGDSAIGFNLSELETAAREQLDLVVVVACDFAWSMEALGQQQEMGHTLGLETEHVRYDEVAKALGCAGELVVRAEEIRPALQRAADADGPVLVQVNIDPDENLAPPFLQQFLDMYAAEES
jgi:acetolactate synthase-1/2/3 large subunit